MRLEHYSTAKLRKEIKQIVGKYLNLNSYRLFFFGSRVTNKGSKYSDIDIGIEGSKSIPLKTMAKIREKIDKLPILYKIEMVDFKNTPLEFRKTAKKKIEKI